MKPIQVFVRHCHKSPNADIPGRERPKWFSKDACWKNLLLTSLAKNVNITVIYDMHFGRIPDILKYPIPRISTEEVDVGSEAQSFLYTLESIERKNFSDDTIIYLLEDDYLHRGGWDAILREGFTTDAHYVTLYDHADKYQYYPDLTSKILVTPSCHWRTTPSTTNTFACTMKQLREDMDAHRKFSAGAQDGVTNDCAKFEWLGSLGRVLISSIPGYSTHCDQLQSPTINWELI